MSYVFGLFQQGKLSRDLRDEVNWTRRINLNMGFIAKGPGCFNSNLAQKKLVGKRMVGCLPPQK